MLKSSNVINGRIWVKKDLYDSEYIQWSANHLDWVPCKYRWIFDRAYIYWTTPEEDDDAVYNMQGEQVSVSTKATEAYPKYESPLIEEREV